MKDYKELVKQAFAEVLANPTFDRKKITQYFSTDYKQHVDGKILDYDQFVAHVELVKKRTSGLIFDYATIVQEGKIVFTNHKVTATMENGEVSVTHLIAEFHIEQDRIVYCSEMSRLLTGKKEDGDLGSAH
jgi:hypothetical protein